MKLEYDYNLPGNLIAKQPAVLRDSSRLFVYDTATDTITLDRFFNLHHHLPNNSFLVLNKTKVVPARVNMQKPTGGKVVCLLLVNEIDEKARTVPAFIDRKVSVGDRLTVHDSQFTVTKQDRNIFTLGFNMSKQELFHLLREQGNMPIPPYIKNTPLNREELKSRYQTVFAQTEGSAAAPTASLHFTDRVLNNLEQNKIDRLNITLHVGLGTFAPIGEKELKSGKLHAEQVEIPHEVADEMHKRKQEGQKLVAVGTTVVRSLESAVSKINDNYKIEKMSGKTQIFIRKPYRFHAADALITNFHLPNSSLMMLVDAFLEYKQAKRGLVDLYKIAIKEQFRFYSFGDAMLIR
jgi:S-adenosylmethionine:tRNA ribosyltransferase-isomerase